MANTTARGAEAIHGQNPQVFAPFFAQFRILRFANLRISFWSSLSFVVAYMRQAIGKNSALR
jgi:hypothetical protein